MILYVDSESKVRAVNSTTDDTLTPLYVDENNESFPFEGWSVSKICCYMVTVVDGVVTMYTPYVDSSLIEHIDQLGKQIEAATPYTETKTAYIDDTFLVFTNVPSGNLTVYFDKPYTVEREADRVTVRFEALEEVTPITISII